MGSFTNRTVFFLFGFFFPFTFLLFFPDEKRGCLVRSARGEYLLPTHLYARVPSRGYRGGRVSHRCITRYREHVTGRDHCARHCTDEIQRGVIIMIIIIHSRRSAIIQMTSRSDRFCATPFLHTRVSSRRGLHYIIVCQ